MIREKTKASGLPDHPKFHLLEPDYRQSQYLLPSKLKKKILEKLVFLYGERQAKSCLREINRIMKV